MRTKVTVVLAMLSGIAIGGITVSSLNAQAKPKAYSIFDVEVIDRDAARIYTPLIQAAYRSAGATIHETAGGKIVALEGTPPKVESLIEWPSLDRAEAFFNSAAWKDLAPQRDKGIKFTRRFIVEATK